MLCGTCSGALVPAAGALARTSGGASGRPDPALSGQQQRQQAGHGGDGGDDGSNYGDADSDDHAASAGIDGDDDADDVGGLGGAWRLQALDVGGRRRRVLQELSQLEQRQARLTRAFDHSVSAAGAYLTEGKSLTDELEEQVQEQGSMLC